MTGGTLNRRCAAGLLLALAGGAAWPVRAADPAPPAPRDANGGAHEETLIATIRKPVKLRYLVWMPTKGERPPAGWPLMIFLHGSGERGADLSKVTANGPPEQAASGRDFPFILVAPQAERGSSWDSDEIEALRAHLAETLPVDPDRVVVTGLSMGGYGAWNYAASYPDRLAAIAPVCGIGDTERARRVARVPVWAFHGALDDVVPLAGDLEMVTRVRRVGGWVRFTIYPDTGHDAWDQAYAEPDLYDWLLRQRRGRPAVE